MRFTMPIHCRGISNAALMLAPFCIVVGPLPHRGFQTNILPTPCSSFLIFDCITNFASVPLSDFVMKAKTSLTFAIVAGFIRGAMRNRSCVCLLWLFSCLSLVWNAAAQPNLAISVSASPDPVAVGNTLVYTLITSNASAGIGTAAMLNDVIVSNTLPSSVTLVGVTGGQGTNVSGSLVVITNGTLNFQQRVTNTITVTPMTAGTISNFVVVRGLNQFLEPVSAMNSILTTVTNAGRARLEGVLKADQSAVYVNDWLSYSLMFTNAGNATANSVSISNLFSRDVRLLSVSSGPVNFTGNSFVLTAGSLAPGAGDSVAVLVQPTNTGPLVITAAFAGSNLDTNDSTTASITNAVVMPDTNQLVVTNISLQVYDPQTGLMRQTVQVLNVSGTNVDSVRLVVTGLGTNRLFNAVGTNDQDPFVVYGAPLGPDEVIDMVLEYFVRNRQPVDSVGFIAYEAHAPDTPISAPTSPPITDAKMLSNPDRFLIEFASEPGATYAVMYSDSMSSTNARRAHPLITAPADRTQWIDDGPPKTISAPGVSTNRMYWVIKQ
jgi:uncharacterized repeat protein (TIGR01451 family)